MKSWRSGSRHARSFGLHRAPSEGFPLPFLKASPFWISPAWGFARGSIFSVGCQIGPTMGRRFFLSVDRRGVAVLRPGEPQGDRAGSTPLLWGSPFSI